MVKYQVIQDFDEAYKLVDAGLAQVRFRYSGEKWQDYHGRVQVPLPYAWTLKDVHGKPIARQRGEGNGRCWRIHGVYYQARVILEE